MINGAGYGDISLNFNDTFAPACAWAIDCDEYDLLAVARLYEKYGIDGVIAWGAVKEGIKKPLGGRMRFPNFFKAQREILAHREKYFWIENYQNLKSKGGSHES